MWKERVHEMIIPMGWQVIDLECDLSLCFRPSDTLPYRLDIQSFISLKMNGTSTTTWLMSLREGRLFATENSGNKSHKVEGNQLCAGNGQVVSTQNTFMGWQFILALWDRMDVFLYACELWPYGQCAYLFVREALFDCVFRSWSRNTRAWLWYNV